MSVSPCKVKQKTDQRLRRWD